jgi:hypothetical protein
MAPIRRNGYHHTHSNIDNRERQTQEAYLPELQVFIGWKTNSSRACHGVRHQGSTVRFEDRGYAIEVFHRHNEEVRRAVPPDQLLAYEVKEGCGPLCGFLGVPVPEGEPFPHVNDAEEFRSRIRRMSRTVRAVAYIILGLAALLVAWLAMWIM